LIQIFITFCTDFFNTSTFLMAISAFLAGVTGAVSWLAAAANAAVAAAQAAQAAQGAQGQAANRLGQVNNDAPKQGA
jgi:hypothetical protein